MLARERERERERDRERETGKEERERERGREGERDWEGRQANCWNTLREAERLCGGIHSMRGLLLYSLPNISAISTPPPPFPRPLSLGLIRFAKVLSGIFAPQVSVILFCIKMPGRGILK